MVVTKVTTPFLDSLISNSLTFEITLANGKKSIDAMPSIFASLPSLETPYTISHYANKYHKWPARIS